MTRTEARHALPASLTNLIRDARAHASSLGVDLDVEYQEEQERLTFAVKRGDGAPGSGEAAIRHLLRLADAEGIPVAIDVADSIPALIRYYWRFGFRAFSDDDAVERAELEAYAARRDELLREAGGRREFGVTFMWRDGPGGNP